MTTADTASDAARPMRAADDVGKRFLKLIDRLNASGDITLGQLAEAMAVPVGQMEPRHNGYTASISIGENWSYALELWQETSSSPWTSIVLRFDQADLHEYADFAAVCGMTLDAYRDAFKARGLQEKIDYDGAGRLLAANYATDKFFIVVKPGLKNAADDKAHPACVRSIELMSRKSGG